MQPPSDRISIWNEWIRKHAEEMAHIANFEIKFVLEVLSKIPEIDPEDLIPQYPFYDAQKKLRRIDFLILSPEKGFALAIELDGYSKIQSYSDWEDLFVRQNALLESLNCMLLRYANRLWLNKPKHVIAEIRDTLRQQSIAHQARLAVQQSRAENAEDLKRLIEENRKVRAQVEELKASFERFQDATSRVCDEPKINAKAAIIEEQSECHIKQSVNEKAKSDSSTQKSTLFLVALLVFGLILFCSAKVVTEPKDLPIKNEVPSPSPVTSIASSKQVELPHAADNDRQPSTNPVEIEEEKAVNHAEEKCLTVKEARFHVGENWTVCGYLAQVVDGDKYSFLNFELKYPDNTFAGVIPNDAFLEFKGINLYVGKEVCIKGIIETYRDKPQIRLRNTSQWIR